MASTKLLIEDSDQDYNISKEDVLIYAQQIGIDIDREKHLLWIAEEGLSANVPEPWMVLCDKKDRIFYYNDKTHERSWNHPLDKEYAVLVSEERSKSKSLNSVSSDYGFESKLSSLADAPPLSSSGKNSPPPIKRGKKEGGLSSKKIEFGRFENRRGTQLAPVRLNTGKMPSASTPMSSGGMSFMPKGATLAKNLRQPKDETDDEDYGHPPPDDSNESLNSDDGSKYSYEETEEEEKHIHGLEPYDMLDASPMHSADESLDALDINSLVQLGTKLPPRLDSNLKREQIENKNKGNSPSLSFRKVGQPSFLKPLAQNTKKKGTSKSSKSVKKGSAKKKYQTASEIEFEDKISALNDEQKLMLEKIEKEWLIMQDELEKQEKEKYEEMLKDSSRKLKEEEMKLRKENFEKISKIKNELQKKVEDEQSAAEKNLETLRAANKENICEEEKKFQKELGTLSESFSNDIKNLKEKHANELAQMNKELEEKFNKEIEILTNKHNSNKNNLENCHLTEISKLEEDHKKKIEEIQSLQEKEEEEGKKKVHESSPKVSDVRGEIQNLEKLLKEETEKYKNLLEEKENILKDLTIEKESLEKAKKERANTEAEVAELHDEVEKIENDLDLLRSEKSAFISELNILKENIKEEKSNLFSIENKIKSYNKEVHSAKEFVEVGINTHLTFFHTFDKASQATISGTDVSCQVENVIISATDATCQTYSLETASCKSCQTDSMPSMINKVNMENGSSKEQLNSNMLADKNLESALDGLSMKLDSRINGIENQLRLLQENLSKSSTDQPISYSQEFIENQFTEVKTVPNSENKNIFSHYLANTFPDSIPIPSHKKCKCEVGDTTSCDVLQDVKNSVYHLNDILTHNFVPPLGGSSFYQVSQPMNSYSSPFDSFYAQLREMQEKYRLTELKHKCENEAVNLSKNSSITTDAKSFGNISEKESIKPSYHLMHSALQSYNVPEDPLIRARNFVLREKAKAWKDQQSLSSSLPHIFSMR